MTRKQLELAVAIAFLMQPSCVRISAQENSWWPQFRGPNAIGVTESGEYPSEFNAEKNLIWQTKIPHGVSSPCIWNDRIFVTAYDDQRKQLEALCINRESGKILWREDIPAKEIEKVHEVSSPANATPATDGRLVFVYCESFGLIAFDFQGNEVWRRPLPMRESSFGSGTSPIVVDGRIILNRDNPRARRSGRSELLAIDAKTGEELWSTRRNRTRVKYSTPTVWHNQDKPQVLVLGSNRLTAYELASGEESWFVEGLPPQACATPVVHDSKVYVTATGMFGEPESLADLPKFSKMVEEHDGNKDGALSAAEIPADLLVIDRHASNGAGNTTVKQFFRGIDQDRDEHINEKEWSRFVDRFGGSIKDNPPGVFAIKLGGKGDVSQENIVWTNPRGVAEIPSLLLYSGKMFLVRNGGIVHCRDLETGKDIYHGRLGALGGYYASPVAADGKVYFASDRGIVTVIDGHSSNLEVLASKNFQEPILATPALVNGNIYIRTASSLYAFGQE